MRLNIKSSRHLRLSLILLTAVLFWTSAGLSPLFAQSTPADAAGRAGTPLNKSLKNTVLDEQPIDAFRDTVVVQRKAMNKGGRFLFSTYGSLDFSDGPYTMYSFQFNPGYALSDFWEIYLNFAPYFINSERAIVAETRERGFEITASKVKLQYGVEVLWAPAYGKDSIGSKRVIRSDTFFKMGVMKQTFEEEGSGYKVHVGLGKTFFITNYLGFRPVLSGNWVQSLRDTEKKFRFVAMGEAGLVGYF